MARVEFTANLQRHLACPVQHAPGNTVHAVLDAVFTAHPQLRSYILDDQGRLRKHVAVYVNAQRISDTMTLAEPVADDDEVFAMQALSGG